MSSSPVVIAGAGHAGVQAAASLREDGFDGEIVLLSDEKDLPYQRPPLSKAFLKGEMDIHGLPLRAEAYFRDQRIDLRLGVRATRIDRAAQRVGTSDGKTIGYGHLILATGARRRRLEAPGVELPGVFYLRTIADATRIRERLAPGRKVVVIGAGFIGLEIAATAANFGADVTVVEIARPMGRAVSTVMSDFFLKAHGGFGAKFRIGRGVTAITGAGKAEAVVLTDGEVLPADTRDRRGRRHGGGPARARLRARMHERRRRRRASADFRSGHFGDRRLRRFSQRSARLPHPARVDPERRRPGEMRRGAARRQAEAL